MGNKGKFPNFKRPHNVVSIRKFLRELHAGLKLPGHLPVGFDMQTLVHLAVVRARHTIKPAMAKLLAQRPQKQEIK